MLSLLTPGSEEFNNYKCGEIYCQSPTIYNVSCCMCGIRLAFDEFPEHFQKLHLNYEEIHDATVVEEILIDVEVKAESPFDEMDNQCTADHESEDLSSVDELPIEFMEVKLPKLDSSKANNFIAEHCTMDFECFEESVDTQEQIDISTDHQSVAGSRARVIYATKPQPKSKKGLTVKRFAMESTEKTGDQSQYTDSTLAQYEDSETQHMTRAPCRASKTGNKIRNLGMNSQTHKSEHQIHAVDYDQTLNSTDADSSLSDNTASIAKTNRNKEKEEQFSCTICERLYRSKRGLSNHIRLVHKTSSQIQPKQKKDYTFKPQSEKPTSFVCDLCGKAFSALGNLNTHKKRHTGEKSHKCPLCDNVFHTDHEMQSHKMRHTDLLPVICEVCGRGFRNTGKLKAHMLRHTGERPAKCEVCHKGFFSVHDLNVHRVTHTKDRPFSCDVCGSTFRTKKALRIHGRLHISDRTNACKWCGKAFIEASGLDSHMRQVHMKEPLKHF